ncbi:MAG: nucleotide exchange factor GrpE [Dehalococcoidia bacterium]|nr:nucleotide exchange factor GrpE [Dehalococcoidia bacterium]
MTNENNENTGWQIPPEDPEAIKADYSDLPLEDQIPALVKDLEAAQQEAITNLDLAQRAQADLVNYKRRSDEERISLSKFSNSRLITKLLPVKEELDLAVTHSGTGGTVDSWLEGIKLIQRKLLTLLESEGVEVIEGVGDIFNPVEHEALGTDESTEIPAGHIIEVVRSGYRLQDRVIQPAQVIVSR